MDFFTLIDPNQELSNNFTAREFMCRCGKCKVPNKISMQLVQLLQYMREILSTPIRITSGFRCPAHNKKVGGRPSSQHLTGKAVDVVIDPSKQDMFNLLANRLFAGHGMADTFTHIDVRDNKKARWTY